MTPKPKPGRPHAAYGKTKMIRVPVAMVDQLMNMVEAFKATFRKT